MPARILSLRFMEKTTGTRVNHPQKVNQLEMIPLHSPSSGMKSHLLTYSRGRERKEFNTARGICHPSILIFQQWTNHWFSHSFNKYVFRTFCGCAMYDEFSDVDPWSWFLYIFQQEKIWYLGYYRQSWMLCIWMWKCNNFSDSSQPPSPIFSLQLMSAFLSLVSL